MGFERLRPGLFFSADGSCRNPAVFHEQETIEPEHREYKLSTGDTLVVYTKGGQPTSWTKFSHDEKRQHITLDENFVSRPWIRRRIGEFDPTDLEVVIRHDKSDFRTIDPKEETINSESRKFVPSETLELKDFDEEESPAVKEQKAAVKARAAEEVLRRLKEIELPNNQVRIANLGVLEDNSQIYFIPVDGDLESILQIPGDPASPNKRYRPDENNIHPETGNIILHHIGENLIAQIFTDGSVRFLSSNFGKSKVKAQSAMEQPVGKNGETVKKMIDGKLQRAGIKPNNAGQIRHHLIELIIREGSDKGSAGIPYDPNNERESRLAKYPLKLREYLIEQWYERQFMENLSRIYERHPADREWQDKDLAHLPEELIEFIYNNPNVQPGVAIAEYQLLRNDLHHRAGELIRQAGIGCLGENTDDYIGRLYLEFFEKLGSLNLEDPNQLHAFQRHFNSEQLQQVMEYANQLTQQRGYPDIRRRTLATHMAEVKFGAVVKWLGNKYFDEELLSDRKPDYGMAIDYAINQSASAEPSFVNPTQVALNESIASLQRRDLGPEVIPQNIQSLKRNVEGEFHQAEFATFPEFKTEYPPVVINALAQLYDEYNQAFTSLVERNREWPTDYQYAMKPNGTPLNRWVQIDMVGLPVDFLEKAEAMDVDEVRESLRGNIFEIENSLAMYQLLENLFANAKGESVFNQQFRQSLDDLREEHGKPIALLAVTDQKYEAMRESEFGKKPEDELTDDEVYELSGFDRFFGPEEFQRYLEENNGNCDYLLYARTSDPLNSLIDPSSPKDPSILADSESRRIIKAHVITFNIDDPRWLVGDPRRINDTKGYLEPMNMAVSVTNADDLLDLRMKNYLRSQGTPNALIEHGAVRLRAKPEQGTYGCYGHEVGELGDSGFRNTLADNILTRGSYIIQPERETPKIEDAHTGITYQNIDRVFLGMASDGKIYYMGGFRSLMPDDALEAIRGRNHGNASTRWAPII